MEGMPFVSFSMSLLKLRRERSGLLLVFGVILLQVLVYHNWWPIPQRGGKEIWLQLTSFPVETNADLQNESLVNSVISSDVLEMGIDVLLEIATMVCAFLEMGTEAYAFLGTGTVACAFLGTGTVACAFLGTGIVACAILGMGTVACAFLEMGTLAGAFLEMGTLACAFLEMGTLACALLGMGMDVYLVRICVEQETFDL